MKNKTPAFLWMFIAALAAIGIGLIIPAASAQAVINVADGTMPALAPSTPVGADNPVLVLLGDLAVKYPLIATVIAVLGSMRLWAKPVFSAVHALVELTPSKADDGWWAGIYNYLTNTPSGRTLNWVLDYVASIKVVPPTKKAEPTPQAEPPLQSSVG